MHQCVSSNGHCHWPVVNKVRLVSFASPASPCRPTRETCSSLQGGPPSPLGAFPAIIFGTSGRFDPNGHRIEENASLTLCYGEDCSTCTSSLSSSSLYGSSQGLDNKYYINPPWAPTGRCTHSALELARPPGMVDVVGGPKAVLVARTEAQLQSLRQRSLEGQTDAPPEPARR
ncbi:hypothetical protein PTTG_27656 [Puccinia triticina 1-1 BBBD Race 1]|uniref:Uncharacterized protein n=1 Tax=Puccinia triticina (isolate 1-1 / race 1 (BBBD)) TaxID=630390 RepID=A0A180GIS1_PUCT1|nr:hypothetical protein PTTG_27656 [Puccinia triticina 1-1 BBBD Race 1]